MAPLRENVPGGVGFSRELRRPPLVGMEFLHQRPVRTADLFKARPRLHAKDLIRLLFRHYARVEPVLSGPRVSVSLDVRTPSGRPAVIVTFGID